MGFDINKTNKIFNIISENEQRMEMVGYHCSNSQIDPNDFTAEIDPSYVTRQYTVAPLMIRCIIFT